MSQWRLESKRKPSGGLKIKSRKKKRIQIGRDFSPVTIGETKIKSRRTTGGSRKLFMTKTEYANVSKNGKCTKVKIKSVIENKANSQFVRRNIITKNSIIETEDGKAIVTSRPTQDGAVNAVAVE